MLVLLTPQYHIFHKYYDPLVLILCFTIFDFNIGKDFFKKKIYISTRIWFLHVLLSNYLVKLQLYKVLTKNFQKGCIANKYDYTIDFIYCNSNIVYSSVGFGGGSTYLAASFIMGKCPTLFFLSIALSCNIIVVSGNCINYIRAGNLNLKLLTPYLIGSVPFAFIGGSLPVEKKII